jgi:hypothetical protein
MPEAYILANLEKIITYKKKQFGELKKKKSGILNKGESNIWLLLEQDAQDGTLIFYAEFDKKWYKR